MNDFETLKKMINGKVEFKIIDEKSLAVYSKKFPKKAHFGVEIQNSEDEYDMGYSMFVGVWLFDESGMFLAVGHYE